MRKALSGIALAILSFLFIVLTTGSGSATAEVPSLSIGTVGYNAVGVDNWWNRNREFIDVNASALVDVNGLVVTDDWGHRNNADGVGCNAFKVTSVPGGVGADGTGTGTFLPAGHTLRVYVGAGTAAVEGNVHKVFMDSKNDCGYRGHFINNLGDTLWIHLGGNEESRSFDMRRGYYV